MLYRSTACTQDVPLIIIGEEYSIIDEKLLFILLEVSAFQVESVYKGARHLDEMHLISHAMRG